MEGEAEKGGRKKEGKRNIEGGGPRKNIRGGKRN